MFYNTLLIYGKPNTPQSGEYLFHHLGVKFIEWSNIDNYNEFNVLQISTELTLENRTFQNYLYGLNYRQNDHNIYLIPRLTLGASLVNFEKNLYGIPSEFNPNGFWDLPINIYFELGYDWAKMAEILSKSEIGDRKQYQYIINSFALTYNLRLFPYENIREISYGIKLNLNTFIKFLKLSVYLTKSTIIIQNFNSSIYNLSIEYPFYLF